MEGSAHPLWRLSDGSSEISGLGSHRGARSGAACDRPGSERPGRAGSERMLHRREFCSGEKRGRCVGKTKRGKGTKLMAIADGNGLPLAVCTESASPAEVKLVKETVAKRFVQEVPHKLIADKAYDSDCLDAELIESHGIELIAPHRKNRRADRKTQDGRPLRRYVRRWKVERLFAWLTNYRRIVVRWEYHIENYHAFVQLACALILLKYL